MKGSDISENHQNNCLKVVTAIANFLAKMEKLDDMNILLIYKEISPYLDDLCISLHKC
jgi:hypothetical protein